MKPNKIIKISLIIGIIFILIGITIAIYNLITNDGTKTTTKTITIENQTDPVTLDDLKFQIQTNEDGTINIKITNTTLEDINIVSIDLIVTDKEGNKTSYDSDYNTTLNSTSQNNISLDKNTTDIDKIKISLTTQK